ncbi:hypothetical protein CCR75_008319 [Bremia lactucae]|uniref:Uncharacterized protein n=1 Tax=Bremia lactucae TaxID=4779 RepID=A0A976FIZ2_BRELC|nr:hypothetical protein CCR75_008319 [Bremia lactucae]
MSQKRTTRLHGLIYSQHWSLWDSRVGHHAHHRCIAPRHHLPIFGKQLPVITTPRFGSPVVPLLHVLALVCLYRSIDYANDISGFTLLTNGLSMRRQMSGYVDDTEVILDNWRKTSNLLELMDVASSASSLNRQ